jgi:CRISPR/Cas system-associated endonuclease Cas1
MIPFINQRRSSNPSENYEETLKWAYDQAAWSNPEVRTVLVNEQIEAKTRNKVQAASQARAAAKSITGSPSPGASAETKDAAPDLRAELERQFAAGGARI